MAEADRQPFGEPLPDAPGEVIPSALPIASEPALAPSYDLPLIVEPPVVERRIPPWTIWDVLAMLGVTVLIIFVCSALALAIAHSVPRYRHLSISALAQMPVIVIGAQIASYPIIIALMAMVVRSRSGGPFLSAIRWKWPSRTSPWFYISGIVLAFAVEGIAQLLPIPKSIPMDKFFDDAFSAYLMAFFGILVAPLLEELFFRGMLYPVLRRGVGIFTAVVVTAAAFAAIHGAQLGYAWAPIFSIFLVGVALTLVREFTDSVAASVLLHSGYNSTLFVLLWFGTDHFRHLEKLGV